ncbi:MAG: hypothetical protein ABW137_23060 [Mycobacterium sp.]
MTSRTTVALSRFAIAGLGAASFGFAAFGFAATASAGPECPNSPAGSPTTCCVKVGATPGPGPDCTSNRPVSGGGGLLGDAPVVGNLPGLGGIL